MRSAAIVLAVLLLPTTIFSQDHLTAPVAETASAQTGDFDFAGAVLRVSVDSMNDHQVCSVTTISNGAWIATSGDRTAMIVTTNNRNVDYDRPAFLRIGEAPPFRLGVSRRPHFIAIPFSKSADVVRALYTQQRIRLRFTEWPDGSMFDQELEPGDFAAAYDKGVELCAWTKLSVSPVHPPEEELAKWKAIFGGAPGESESSASPDRVESDSAKALRISMKAVGEPECIYCPPPDFPSAAREAKLADSVILMAKITRDGRAVDISVTREPGAGLGEKAVEAVRAWRFRPPADLGSLPYVVKFIEVKFRAD